MSAVAAPYAELFTDCPPLNATLLDRLSEEEVTTLLRRRFQSFVAHGYDTSDALLRAVGVPDRRSGIALVVQ